MKRKKNEYTEIAPILQVILPMPAMIGTQPERNPRARNDVFLSLRHHHCLPMSDTAQR